MHHFDRVKNVFTFSSIIIIFFDGRKKIAPPATLEDKDDGFSWKSHSNKQDDFLII